MPSTGGNLIPINIYEGFLKEWSDFDDEAQDKFKSFLERLQTNPYDPNIIESSQKRGEYYASRVGPLVVYWKLDRNKNTHESIEAKPDAIHILAVEPADSL